MNSGIDVKSGCSSISCSPVCLYGVLRENFTLLQKSETIKNYGPFWAETLECIMALTAELKFYKIVEISDIRKAGEKTYNARQVS